MTNLSHASDYLNQTNETITTLISEVHKRLENSVILTIFKESFFQTFANNIQTIDTTESSYHLELAEDLLNTLRTLLKNEEKRRQWNNRVNGLSQKRRFKEKRKRKQETKIKKAQETNPYEAFQQNATSSLELNDSHEDNE